MIHSKRIVSSAIRSLFWYTPLRRLLFYRYAYNFTPEQLAFLVQCLNETRDVSRDVFQVGCARGHTTCFLNRYLQSSGIAKNYYCVDTFRRLHG
jgi:hypothetical protein